MFAEDSDNFGVDVGMPEDSDDPAQDDSEQADPALSPEDARQFRATQ